jgi:His/Glu/Gln/Arg/opine family amino acid ABC transporter permease subunit
MFPMPDVILNNLPFLLAGLRTTLLLAAVGIIGGTAMGFILAIVRYLKVPVLSFLATAYIEIVRGIPLLVMLFICSFALPALFGYRPTGFSAAALGFSLFIASYIAEEFRSGLRTVPHSLRQAGLATGLRPAQVFRLIILPQAIRRAIPPLFSQYVRLLKFTSVASVIGVTELTGSAMLVNARDFQPVVILGSLAVTYLVVCSFLSFIGRLLYARLAIRS